MTAILTQNDELAETFRAEAVDLLDAIEQHLLALEQGGAGETGRLQALLRAAHTIKGNSAIMEFEALTALAHAFEDELERIRAGELRVTGGVVSGLLRMADEMRAMIVPDAAPDAESGSTGGTTLRVPVSRLDLLMDLAGEIIIAGAEQLPQLHATLHQEVMRLRMVPLGPTLNAQHRTARDVANRLGRKVRLVIDGGDVEVDTSIAEQIRDPLTHMIRNAVDHGIEAPGDRAAAGKPATGTIVLRTVQEAGAVVLTLTDDGRGLDRERILGRAIALGLTSSPDLTDDEVFSLILEPGFSTAREVTAVSGRGVGMDVVRRHVEALRGTIAIASDPGRGTRITIRLPLTVAIMGGFTVAAGDERYVLPLETVEECFDLRDAAGQTRGQGVLELRGTSLPWISLAGLLGRSAPRGRRAGVVVVRHEGRRLGLVVDGLQGDCQVVIKPLTGVLRRLPGIAGSTIMGDGRAALILDVPRLVDLAQERAGRRLTNQEK